MTYANIIGKIIEIPKVLIEKVETTKAKVTYLVIVCQKAALSKGDSRLYTTLARKYMMK